MSVLSDGIGYESLRFYGPFQPQHIEQLQITRAINDHTFLHISGMLSEEQGAACIGQNMEQEPIVIRQLDDQGQSLRRLFHGIVTRMSVHCVRGVYTFELEAASHSYQMDIKSKKRSYQDIHRTYDDLVTAMVRKYQYGDAIDTVTNYAKLDTFVLQYEETDWAFLKRLASRFGSVLVPEVTAASPKVFFGMPEGKQHKVERDVFYRVRKTFHELDAEKPGEQRAGSYVTYTIESLQYYALGDLITLPIGQGKELVVVRAVTTLADGLLRTCYDLQAEQNIRYARYENDQATGISLTGTVLKVQQDFVQLQLDIDPKQDPAKACWFPVATRYVAEEHIGWYDMPEIGEQVELYLPTHREQDAYVTDSLRQQRHTNGQPNVKVWQHVQGSGVEMSEQELTLSTSDGFSITLNEDGGITINSPGDVQIQGGHVKLDAGEELSLEAGTALYLKGGASSMVLDGETDTHAPVIYQEGTVKAPVFVADLPPVPEPPLMSIKAYEAAQTVTAKSSQAPTPKAKVTTPAALQQANALLGMVSKLLGSIPIVGNVASVMLNTVGGPAGKVAATVLQATGAIPIRSKGTPTVGGSGKGSGVHPLKYLAGLALEGLISHYEHEQAKQAYYSKWILGKAYTSARHLADSGGPLELVQNLLKESNAMAHAYQQIPVELRQRWRANYDSYMAQQPKPQVEEPKSLWDRYLDHTGNGEMVKGQIAMDQAHASTKSANSLVELYKGIEQANNVRYQNQGNSIGEFLDYWSFGIPKGLYQAYMERARNQGNSGSDAINFGTFGITEAIRGAVTPEDPLSPDHWSNIISVAAIVEGAGSFFKPKTILNSPVKEPVHPGPKIINEKTESPQLSNLKPNKEIEIEGVGKITNVGRIVKDGNKTKYTNPAGNELTWVDQHPKNINRDIDNALDSSNVGKATEAKVADFVRKEKEVTGFGQKVLKDNGEAAGDLDVVTKDAIIEVKASIKAVKDDQFNKLTHTNQDYFFNPDKKNVILYIDKPMTNLRPEHKIMLENIKSKGVTIVNSLDELKEVLK
ncbi:phage baseplate assembly protein gpV [Paenibacillus sp. RC254]|uniref:contractile injection system protein, VgrG/Pvc8 family n=1 Tax=unclassified Paenibacillus TaxID=185978 RepID=UPI0024BB2C94|nr:MULTISPECIES: contractile injection system protein, VgrG/Pvc8 family [unclassified Paenibacillus]